jgi:hypothetical protein
MQNHDQQVIRRRLEQVLIAFFVACALFIVVVHIATPSIITQALMRTPSPTERYPLIATVFMLALVSSMMKRKNAGILKQRNGLYRSLPLHYVWAHHPLSLWRDPCLPTQEG